jgi:hypothetical protein
MTQRLLILIIIPTLSFGQPQLSQKFINDAINENNYIVFNSDSTFKYRFSYHLFHDISCGRYRVINDTLFLYYETDLRDTNCNKEIDAQTHFDTGVLAFRPNKLFYKDEKLYKIEKGEIVYKTEKFQPDWGVPKSSRKYYRRKYFLFGPLVSKTKKTHYMTVASKVKWNN